MYKILNLATGSYFNGIVSTHEYNFPVVVFSTIEEAQNMLNSIFYTTEIIRGGTIRKEHFEIIKV